MDELTELLKQMQRLGVPAHVHSRPESDEPCPPGEACISETLPFVACVRAPGGAAKVEVDTMTACEGLADLPDNAGLDEVWASLEAINY